jgi:hypothetical protein
MDRIDELQRSHDQLRAAVILAAREIKRLQFGKQDSPVLAKLREVIREARAVAGKRSRNPQVGSGSA